MRPELTIIIPTLNASKYIENLFDAIENQDYPGLYEILVIDSSSNDDTLELMRKYKRARSISISRLDFTHGASRNLGVKEAQGEYVVFMSQDALPYNKQWLRNLISPMMREGIAATFSRQIPYANATPMERFFLKKRFPERRRIMQKDNSEASKTLDSGIRRNDNDEKCTLGLLDVFFSNVSSAAQRSVALETPFQEDLIMSEDQQFSRDVLKKGYKVSYEPDSVVWHSHRYNLKTIFQRYFDSAYSLTCIFDQDLGDSFKIGIGYYFQELGEILFKYPWWIPYYLCYLTAKTAGALAGHYAEIFPRKWIKHLSMHKGFWERPEAK